MTAGRRSASLSRYARRYATAEGRALVPGQGVSLRLTDPAGRRLGVDPVSGAAVSEIPDARYEPVTNPEPTAPLGPRGLAGTGIALDAPAEGRYLLEVIGTERVRFEIAVAGWDRQNRRRWLHLSGGGDTEPGAVDRYEVTPTRPPCGPRTAGRSSTPTASSS